MAEPHNIRIQNFVRGWNLIISWMSWTWDLTLWHHNICAHYMTPRPNVTKIRKMGTKWMLVGILVKKILTRSAWRRRLVVTLSPRKGKTHHRVISRIDFLLWNNSYSMQPIGQILPSLRSVLINWKGGISLCVGGRNRLFLGTFQCDMAHTSYDFVSAILLYQRMTSRTGSGCVIDVQSIQVYSER